MGYAEKWFPWEAVILGFCSFGSCSLDEAFALFLAIYNRGEFGTPVSSVTLMSLAAKQTGTVSGLVGALVRCAGAIGGWGDIAISLTGI